MGVGYLATCSWWLVLALDPFKLTGRELGLANDMV